MTKKIFSVGELNNYIKQIFDNDRTLVEIFVKGELSNYKTYPSGHHYFSMKDADGALKCVMFKGSAMKLRFKPKDGMSVVAYGRVSVYPKDGAYQLYVNDITPDGIGDLYMAYEQLKEKLHKEGLFDEIYIKPLPRFPKKIAIITSPVGAAVQDIIRILGSRWALTDVIVIPVRVQGDEAPAEIAEAINYANKNNVADLIITGRGGGSIEDLWAFNDERVARAIFASEIPVISAVGHEPDVTIADFVADVRAATPSNAAEIAVPDMLEVYGWLQSVDIRLRQSIIFGLKANRQRINELSEKRVFSSPGIYVEDKRMQIDLFSEKLSSLAKHKILVSRERFAALAAGLDAMSPLKVLGRGYSIAQLKNGTVLKSKKDVKKGDEITVKLQKDEIECIVI
ncbi:MAG: exodeoxyribonuclease VII large subunit [Oscillospiraceae bacterium]|jgi:exodeoxyribonuclease VII large subunit|nr:exodeoxyribonuclease VII large subunit [Oscillospiraceae bacterium]